jgi:sortase A
VIRRLGTLALVVGVALLVWSGTVYVWKDPLTTAYTAYQQRKLDDALDRTFAGWLPAPPRGTEEPRVANAPKPRRVNVRREAQRFEVGSDSGDAIARLEIPRLDLEVVVVNGTDAEELRKGPGRHVETAMPGEGELVYIAGHRTTYGAPFSRIDKLARGDEIHLDLPYASIEYQVTGHRIVDQYEVSVLRSRGREELVLQACHPRFFASHRYLVYAKPVRVNAKRA